MSGLRVLICGSRTWTDTATIARVFRDLPEGTVIIHGAAPGADELAGIEAKANGFRVEEYPADWRTYGYRAGPMRNQRMLMEGKPDRVIAFRMAGPSPGTDDMVRRARAAGIPVEVIAGARGTGDGRYCWRHDRTELVGLICPEAR